MVKCSGSTPCTCCDSCCPAPLPCSKLARFERRGAHILALQRAVGLGVHAETVADSRVIEGLEMDIVSHDVRKFFGLLLKKHGYVREQLFSPLIVQTTPEHQELKEICRSRGPQSAHSSSKEVQRQLTSAAPGGLTKHHSHHDFGFAE